MPLEYTKHARDRMAERGITEAEVEAAVSEDPNPWEQILQGENHLRHFNNQVTVIRTKSSKVVVTVWRGERGGW